MNKVTFDELKDKNVVVIGDLIVDHYRIMKPKRLSPEAPVPIFTPYFEEYRPGGAANVAANLMALGVGTVNLVTVLGRANAPKVPASIIPAGFGPIVAMENDRMTTVKERIVTSRQQVCRIDHQSDCPIKTETAKILLEAAEYVISHADAIIFSDYDHGVCIPELVAPIMSIAIKEEIAVIVDSKAKGTLLKYAGATIAVPNMDEAKRMLEVEGHGSESVTDQAVACKIKDIMGLKAAAITLGPRGILLVWDQAMDEQWRIFPPLEENVEKEVADVTGAGDTVAAAVAAGITLGLPYDRVMVLANVAAGVKVQKQGVATATPEEIIKAAALHGIEI